MSLSYGGFLVVTDLSFNKIDSNNLSAFKNIQSLVMTEIMSMVVSGDIEVTVKRKRRTKPQNRAMRKGWSMASIKLNEAGWSQNDIFKVRQTEIPWCSGSFENSLWRPLQDAFGLPKSTSDLKTPDMSKIWDTLRDQIAKNTSERPDLGAPVDIGPFPSMDTMAFSQL